MSDAPIVISVEQCLESLPAIQEILADPGARFHIVLASRQHMIKQHADIALISAEPGDPAQDWCIRDFRYHTKLVLITSHSGDIYCEEAILRGARGVIDQGASAATILKALDCVARGELWVQRRTSGKVFEILTRGVS